ncbi:MFS transporter [Sutcliffiella horikoshii]|uniref:MFS transporter n=1 Tax=Sutcliffiella horikoshii TaxID=79883 RepID=UPI001CBBF77B|nr:MFS transporter [Sutcliffiella horikoshii]UAL48569.1 MFS transporter [Sutcliffiella horikoshii]
MERRKNHYFSATLLIVMGFLVVCNLYTLIPLYNPISLEWNISKQKVILASSFFSIFYAIGLLMFGPLSDRFGRKKIISYGFLFSALATILIAHSANISHLYVARSIQGFTLGCFAPVAFAYCFDHFSQSLRTFTISLINAGFLLSGIFGPMISEHIVTYFQWEDVFVFFSLVYFLLFVFARLILSSAHSLISTKDKPWKHFFTLLTDRDLRILYLIVFSLLLSFVTFYDSLFQFLSITFPDQSFMLVRSVGLVGTVSCLFSDILMRTVGSKRLLLICSLSISFSFFFMMIFYENLFVIGALSVIYVAAISFFLPAIITYIGILGSNHRGSAISLYSFTLLIGTAVSPIISHNFSFLTVLAFLGIWFLLNAILIWRIRRVA